MSKVPPKINQRPSSQRPRRSQDVRKDKKPGQPETEEELNSEYALETMGERLHRERDAGEEGLFPSDEAREMAEAESRDEDVPGGRDAKRDQAKAPQGKPPSSNKGEQRGQPASATLPAALPTAARSPPPRAAATLADGFEGGPSTAHRLTGGLGQTPARAPQLAPSVPMLPMSLRTGGGFGDAMKFLNDAKEAGFYFKVRPRKGRGEDQEAPGQDEPDDAEETELEAAVQEARAQLEGLRGVERVEAGEDDQAAPVVLISVGRGFCQSSMAAIPERYGRFPTVVGLPYDLLPLRRI